MDAKEVLDSLPFQMDDDNEKWYDYDTVLKVLRFHTVPSDTLMQKCKNKRAYRKSELKKYQNGDGKTFLLGEIQAYEDIIDTIKQSLTKDK